MSDFEQWMSGNVRLKQCFLLFWPYLGVDDAQIGSFGREIGA